MVAHFLQIGPSRSRRPSFWPEIALLRVVTFKLDLTYFTMARVYLTLHIAHCTTLILVINSLATIILDVIVGALETQSYEK